MARFADAPSRQTDLPVNFVDERYTSVEAERLLRESGGTPSKDKPRVDAAAAALILQSYLDARRAGA